MLLTITEDEVAKIFSVLADEKSRVVLYDAFTLFVAELEQHFIDAHGKSEMMIDRMMDLERNVTEDDWSWRKM